MPRSSASRARRLGPALPGAIAALLLAVPAATAFVAGDPDPGFGAAGVAVAVPGTPDFDEARKVAVLPDGRIVVAGRHRGAGTDTEFFVARHLPDGGLDPAFGDGGVRVTPISGGLDEARALALDLQGRILVAGTANQDVAVVRYTPEGDEDTSFSGDGIATVSLAPGIDSEHGIGVVPLSGGKIVLAGRTYEEGPAGGHRLSLIRLTNAGQPDATFGPGGIKPIALGGSFLGKDIQPAPGARLVVAGSFETGGVTRTAVVRLDAATQPDATFSANGIADPSSGPSSQQLAAVRALPDGSVLAAGSAETAAGNHQVVLRRFEADGDPDPAFGTNGLATTDFGVPVSGLGEALAVEPDGRVVVGGHTTQGLASGRAFAARYLPGGEPDLLFGGDGVVEVATGDPPSARAAGVAVAPSGRILLAGTARGADQSRIATLFGIAGADGPPAGVPVEPGGDPAPPDTSGTTPSPLPPPAAPADGTAPRLTKASVKVRSRRARVRFTLSEAATVTIVVKRRGKRSRRRATVTAATGAGRAVVRVRGRRRLARGRYVATLVAVDAAGNRSRARTVRFRVRR